MKLPSVSARGQAESDRAEVMHKQLTAKMGKLLVLQARIAKSEIDT